MRRFRNILFLTILQLLLLSSCSCNLHKHILYRGYVNDRVVSYDGKAPLYQVGNRVYAQGIVGPARGCGKYDYNSTFIKYCIDTDSATPIYLPISLRSSREILRGETHLNGVWDDKREPLTTLPANAKKLKSRHICGLLREEGTSRLDAHALYAFPLGALTAVGIDLPVTIIMKTCTAAAVIVALPVYGPLYYIATKKSGM